MLGGNAWPNEKGVGPLRPGVTSFQCGGHQKNAVRHKRSRRCPFPTDDKKKRKLKKNR